MLPETDLNRIRLWARERVSEHLWDELKVEADFADRHVTIVEVRPPWDGVGAHNPVPDRPFGLHQDDRTVVDLLARSQPQFHEYKWQEPSRYVQSLLDHIENSGDPIFWA